MCPTISYSEGKTLMSDAVFEKAIDYIKKNKVAGIDMTGWGEPLLDKKLAARVRKIKDVDENILVRFITNGTLLNKERIDELLDAGVNQINISFDAATKETYQKIRRRSDYDKVMLNLEYLGNAKRGECSISAAYVVMKDNFYEMEKFVDLFYSLKFDSVCFKPLNVVSSEAVMKYVVKRETIYDKYLKIKEKFKDKIQVDEWDMTKITVKNNCLADAIGTVFISSNGDVSPCCWLGHHVSRINERSLSKEIRKDIFYSYGNLNIDSLEQIIKGNKCSDLIGSFKNGELPAPCKGCNLAEINPKGPPGQA
jgi:MoaA/NifB/PqqE/SkfB family radical SAM enzyme